MAAGLDELPSDIRDLTLAALRLRRPKLVRDRADHHAERTVLGELALEEGIGASADSWQVASRAISLAEAEAAVVRAQMNGGDVSPQELTCRI